MIRVLDALTGRELDKGTEHFQPSNLEVTTIDAGNPATNVVPAKISAAFNIRFNDQHTGAELEQWIRDVCTEHGGRMTSTSKFPARPSCANRANWPI